MNRNVRKSNDCISVGKEEKLMRINSLTLVQFPSAIDKTPQLWSWRETVYWKNQILDLFSLLVSQKKHSQDLSCNRKCLVLPKNHHKEKRMESEFWNGQCLFLPHSCSLWTIFYFVTIITKTTWVIPIYIHFLLHI